MRHRPPMWASSVAITASLVAAIVALGMWSFWQRWQLLAGSPFPLGVDGYFYAIELRSLLDRGELHYPASPLAFYLLAPFAAATDPITGAKLGAAVLGAAIAGPAYGVGARLGQSRGAGLIAAVIATTSVGSAYLTVEFVKNGIGLTVALTALWLALVAAEHPGRRRIAAAIAGLAAAYATHKMAAALVLAVALPAAIAAAASRGALRGRRLLIAIAALAALFALAALLGALSPQRFLSAGDAGLVRGLVSSTPRWTAPALAFPGGELALGRDALLGLALALIIVAALIWRAWRSARAPVGQPVATERIPAVIAAATWPVIALALVIGLPLLDVTDRQGLGFRLRIAAFVPTALCAALWVRVVLPRALRRDLALAAVALALAVQRQPAGQLEGTVVTHPALVSAAQALHGRVPADATLIIPERHIAFMVAWYTGAPVAIRPDRIPRDRRVRLLPLHFIRADSPLDRALLAARAEPTLVPPLGVHPRHPNGLVLVDEATWAWVLDRLPPEDRARYARWPTI